MYLKSFLASAFSLSGLKEYWLWDFMAFCLPALHPHSSFNKVKIIFFPMERMLSYDCTQFTRDVSRQMASESVMTYAISPHQCLIWQLMSFLNPHQ